MTSPVYKAMLWHQGKLPPGQSLNFYDLHVAGPKVHGPVRFHTYACLFPEKELYVAENTGAWPGCSISAVDLRQIIASAEAPPEKVADQRQIAARYLKLPNPGNRYKWDYALAAATMRDLPIGFYAVGDTVDKNERVVDLRVMAVAPLAMVIAKFKELAPQSSPN